MHVLLASTYWNLQKGSRMHLKAGSPHCLGHVLCCLRFFGPDHFFGWVRAKKSVLWLPGVGRLSSANFRAVFPGAFQQYFRVPLVGAWMA